MFCWKVFVWGCLLLAALQGALSQAPKNRIDAITAALSAKDYTQALQLSRAALQQFPRDEQLWVLQGIALGSTGDNKGALASFQQALAIAPMNWPPINP